MVALYCETVRRITRSGTIALVSDVECGELERRLAERGCLTASSNHQWPTSVNAEYNTLCSRNTLFKEWHSWLVPIVGCLDIYAWECFHRPIKVREAGIFNFVAEWSEVVAASSIRRPMARCIRIEPLMPSRQTRPSRCTASASRTLRWIRTFSRSSGVSKAFCAMTALCVEGRLAVGTRSQQASRKSESSQALSSAYNSSACICSESGFVSGAG